MCHFKWEKLRIKSLRTVYIYQHFGSGVSSLSCKVVRVFQGSTWKRQSGMGRRGRDR